MQAERGFAADLISRKMGGRVAARVNSGPDTKLQDDLGGGTGRVQGLKPQVTFGVRFGANEFAP